jgi:hypothetical protein
MLVHKDEGVKLEAGTDKEKEKEKEKEKDKEEKEKEKDNDKDKETNSLIASIFQNIKCSEDVVDREKSKVGEKCLSLYLVFTLCIKSCGLNKKHYPRENIKINLKFNKSKMLILYWLILTFTEFTCYL